MKLTVKSVPIGKVGLDPANVRTHDARNLKAISDSLSTFGQRKPIVVMPADGGFVVIAGNGTLEAAKALGWETISVSVVPEGWTSDEAAAYAIADNRSSELAAWDEQGLKLQLVELEAAGWDMEVLGFEPVGTGAEDVTEEDNPYTAVVNIPQYDVVGERPAVGELANHAKAEELIADITAAEIEPDLRAFLLAAAGRHIVFDYRKIAEYYPHAPVEVQRLFEASALVIIDYKDAIRDGYVRLMKTVDDLRDRDRHVS